MCRRILFISMVAVAVSSIALAQPSWPTTGQQTYFVGGGGTHAAQYGGLDTATDESFQTSGQVALSSSCCSPCSTKMNQSNSAYLDQATAAGGCGGSSAACQSAIGSGFQSQVSGNVPSLCGPTCYPYSSQQQVIGGGGTQGMYATCGNNGASASQTGSATESQGIVTPSTGGSQYQYLAGSQGGMVAYAPTSYASANGITGGGGSQCQTFGGITFN